MSIRRAAAFIALLSAAVPLHAAHAGWMQNYRSGRAVKKINKTIRYLGSIALGRLGALVAVVALTSIASSAAFGNARPAKATGKAGSNEVRITLAGPAAKRHAVARDLVKELSLTYGRDKVVMSSAGHGGSKLLIKVQRTY